MYEIVWEEFRRNTILRVSFRNCTPEEFNEGVLKARELITAQAEKSLLTFSEYYSVKWTAETIKLLNEAAKAHAPFIIASAFRLDGLLKPIFKGALAFSGRKNMRVFEDDGEAKGWLVEQRRDWELHQALQR